MARRDQGHCQVFWKALRVTRPSPLVYVCLEAPREGVASYVHVHEIIAGLKRRDWDIDLCAPDSGSGWKRPGLIRRLSPLGGRRLAFGLEVSDVGVPKTLGTTGSKHCPIDPEART